MKSMTNTFFSKFRGSENFSCTVGGFSNERKYSGADWVDPLLPVSIKGEVFKTLTHVALHINPETLSVSNIQIFCVPAADVFYEKCFISQFRDDGL